MAGKGGGAWKVAYADFVTAMMAFFLVMWLCAQDQATKSSVSNYFIDPFGASKSGVSKKPSHTGSIAEFINGGNVPRAESVAMGQGRNSHTAKAESSLATKLVSDWLHGDKGASDYWREQARRHKEQNAAANAEEKAAAVQLSKQLKHEITQGIPPQAKGLYQDLLFEIVAWTNWNEIAEDLLAR